MTFEEKIRKMLIDHGLFDNQADEVMKRLKASDLTEAMQNRWNDSVEGYPEMMVNILWLSAKAVALEYIDEVAPLAWFRPMFAQ